MTDLHPWQEATRPLTGELQQPIDSSIILCSPGAGEEVIRLNKDGFHYRGQLIEDAGEAHRLMVRFLRQGTFPALAEQPVAIGLLWQPCVKLPITVHVREQRPGETHISTREGITSLRHDDLIMRGVQGEEYLISRELFEQTYRMEALPND